MRAAEAERADRDPGPTRRLLLSDLGLMVVSAAVAAAMLRRAIVLTEPRTWDLPWRQGTPAMVAASPLLAFSVGLLIARSRRPRPGWRDAIRQPGTLACLLILAEVAVNIASAAALNASWRYQGHRVAFEPFGLLNLLTATAFNGGAVAVGWATLALAGRWRPEPTWVDRSGRALGWLAIAVELQERLVV